MANMNYCRFQNTSYDLRECVEALQDAMDIETLDLSKTEQYHMMHMEKLCKDYLEELERLNYRGNE